MSALLRKGVLLPVEGLDYKQPSTFINDRAGFPQNVRFLRSEIVKRPGKSLYQDAACPGTQIMGLDILRLSTVSYLLRVSKTTLQYYNTSTSTWDTISSTSFTGGDEDYFHFSNVTEDQIVILTNYVDRIRKWTGSGNNSLLGGSPPFAKYITYVTPYVMLAYINDGSTVQPWKVQWCDTNAPETWTGGNSGSALLSTDSSPIQNIKSLNEFAAVYKEESLWLGRKVDTTDVFLFSPIKTGIGLVAPRALAEAEGKHYFMGSTDFYVWNGIREESIGAPVRDEVFSSVDRAKIKRCFAIHIKNLQEIWFFVLKSGETWPQHVWKYNYRNGFWYYDTCSSITTAVAWKKISTESWNDDSGTWDEAIDDWDSGTSIADWEEIVFGDSSARTLRLDYNTTDDAGNAVSSHFVSKDYTADVLERYKRWLQLDVWARGTPSGKLYVDYSIDFGTTWVNIPFNPSTAYITLTETSTLFRIYFDIIAEHIRFRFRNYESGEIFYLRNFYPYYLGREEVNK